MGGLPGVDDRRAGVLGMIQLVSTYVFSIAAFIFLLGCSSPDTPAVVADEEVMLFLKSGLRPEVLLFPEYLLLEDLELDAHGRIRESTWIGAGLQTKLPLKAVHENYQAVLLAKGWRLDPAEVTLQSVRIMASKAGETLEIRVVQGIGSAQIFILYRPLVSAD